MIENENGYLVFFSLIFFFSYFFCLHLFLKPWHRLGRKSGTFSAREKGSTRMAQGQTGLQLQGIGRPQVQISLYVVELKRLGWRNLWFSMEGSHQKGSKLIGSCMSTVLLKTSLTIGLLGVTWATRKTP